MSSQKLQAFLPAAMGFNSRGILCGMPQILQFQADARTLYTQKLTSDSGGHAPARLRRNRGRLLGGAHHAPQHTPRPRLRLHAGRRGRPGASPCRRGGRDQAVHWCSTKKHRE